MKIADAMKDLPRRISHTAQHSRPSVMAVVVAMVCTLFALMKVKFRSIAFDGGGCLEPVHRS